MARESFHLDGAAALDAQLAALGEAAATDIGRAAVEAAADALKNAWVAGASYAQGLKHPEYGRLRTNITIGPVKAQSIHAVVFKVTTGDAFWGYFLEYGTVKMAAQPWARPINDKMKSTLIEIEIAAINDGLERAVSGRNA